MGKINFPCFDSLSIKHTLQLKIFACRIPAKRSQNKEAVTEAAREFDPTLERDRLRIPIAQLEKK